MMSRLNWVIATCAVILLAIAAIARATTTTVDYGRIAAVNLVTERSSRAQTRGTILGGALGAVATHRASGAVAGGIAGNMIGRRSGRRQTFEYTIQFDGRSNIRVVTDEAGMRVGDCVAVERGNFNNLRLVDDDRCARNTTPTQEAMHSADACITAKEQLLAAKTDEEFDRAERKVRLLCDD